MKRWIQILCGVLLVVHVSSGTELQKPNIVLFIADDQSVFDYGAYGNGSVPTGVTDRFAAESLLFERAYTGQAICAPSRSIMYTGLYPVRNGCFINHTAIRPGVRTLPGYLKPLGYEVVLAGKSHVKPMSQFDWSDWFPPKKVEGRPRPALPFERMESFFETAEGPFCMVVASEYPHGPFFEKSRFSPEEVALEPFRNQSEEERKYTARYYANIEAGESEFERVLRLLEAHELAGNTVVVYVADHGMFRGKFTVYDSGLRVPMMVRWPGGIRPGRSDALVSLTDLVPTFIEVAGGRAPEGLDGKSLLPVWRGESETGHAYVFGVGESQGIQDRSLFPQRSVSDGRYRYIFSFNSAERLRRDEAEGVRADYFRRRDALRFSDRAEEELYDLAADPFELKNRAGEAAVADVKRRLRQVLFEWMESQGDYLRPEGALPYFHTHMHPMDEANARYNYRVPAPMAGSLRDQYVDPQALTE